jgi:hypothetical protein
MMTPEESRVLSHLRSHLMSTVEETARACLPAGSLEQARRILWNLEWHGYIIRYGSGTVQITMRGASVT